MPLPSQEEFYRIQKLPPYVFAVINELRDKARAAGVDIIDMGMGNPDGATPQPVVNELIRAAQNPINHRYSMSRGIPALRQAIVERYKKQYDVTLDSEAEAIVTIGAKDALAHLLLAIIRPGDVVVSPNPAYPIHQYGVVMAEGEACMLPMPDAATFLSALKDLYRSAAKKPKVILISFPHNPTTITVDLDFMREIVELARQHGTFVVHDFAYAELGFDGYRPPSILQIPGAMDYAVEIYSMTKSYNMAGWRVGFCLGNRRLVAALTRIKSYLDYGMFQPIQIAAVTALKECNDAPAQICRVYETRRNVLIRGLREAGWAVDPPKATMFTWARIPEAFAQMGSLEFAKVLMRGARVAVSPGVGFGPMGEGFVRFSLIEDEDRTREATRNIGRFLESSGVFAQSGSAPVHV
ncbi:MAG TPA: aminotransferase class I/II-fold pyridoxal phosphate-dependent enzyme [Bryobacteraceae bacterium]|nr:aminotransferase class I/II-fold pyridoxal phosphate-dependent enzyme [Bryobacteraceae bacterium]